jgi:hypothetical protein
MRLSFRLLCFALCLLVVVFSQPSRAAFVVGWDAVDTGANSAQSSINGTGVTTGFMTRGSGISYVTDSVPPPMVDYVSSSWTDNATVPDTNDAIYFELRSSAAYDLTDFRVIGERSADGPKTFRLQVDLAPIDGSFVTVGSDFSLGLGITDMSFDLSSLDGITNADFRLLGFNSAAPGSTSLYTIVDTPDYASSGESNVVINGVIAAIPEPSSFLFGGLVCGVIGLGAVKRRLANAKQAA